MSDTLILGRENNSLPEKAASAVVSEKQSAQPTAEKLYSNLMSASRLVDDIVLKKYLHKLSDLEIVPLEDDLKKISDIRIFKITEMVYQKDEYSTYKFASVFNSVQNLNCGVFIIADSDGQKTNFYMGVRSLDSKRTTKSLKNTLRNALCGQFPGVKTEDLLDPDAEAFLSKISSKNIASVSCVAQNKDDEFKNNETFIQGLEKLAIAMQGQKYTVIILAKSTPSDQLEETKKAYETVYTQLSPYSNMQLSYGTNTAISISDALSHGTTTGTSYSKNSSVTNGESHTSGTSESHTEGTSESHSIAKQSGLVTAAKALGSAAASVAGIALAAPTGGLSLFVAGGLSAGINSIPIKTYTDSKGTSKSDTTSKTESDTVSISKTSGESFGTNESISDTATRTQGNTSGTSNNMQLTLQNKNLIDTMEKIEHQLKRIDECESLGMWECAAYILSDTQETAEMAAGTYKALMKGENSGVETSAVNFWGKQKTKQISLLREYITNFIHPVFEYSSNNSSIPVTASSLVSSNELAIHMGFPRRSVCGFPVIEHADFGKEVVKYSSIGKEKDFQLGYVFGMGRPTETEVNLDCNSLTMHTFITGSTGAGKIAGRKRRWLDRKSVV